MALQNLYEKPGYQIRRLRQIAAAIFSAETAAFDITSQQWTTLQALGEVDSLEQNVLADVLSLDRATMATLLARLEKKGLVRRTTLAVDRRRKAVALTARGRRLLAAMEPAVGRVQEIILEPLPPDERRAFARMLKLLVEAHGAAARTRDDAREKVS